MIGYGHERISRKDREYKGVQCVHIQLLLSLLSMYFYSSNRLSCQQHLTPDRELHRVRKGNENTGSKALKILSKLHTIHNDRICNVHLASKGFDGINNFDYVWEILNSRRNKQTSDK